VLAAAAAAAAATHTLNVSTTTAVAAAGHTLRTTAVTATPLLTAAEGTTQQLPLYHPRRTLLSLVQEPSSLVTSLQYQQTVMQPQTQMQPTVHDGMQSAAHQGHQAGAQELSSAGAAAAEGPSGAAAAVAGGTQPHSSEQPAAQQTPQLLASSSSSRCTHTHSATGLQCLDQQARKKGAAGMGEGMSPRCLYSSSRCSACQQFAAQCRRIPAVPARACCTR
jgi:hypothetical protein